MLTKIKTKIINKIALLLNINNFSKKSFFYKNIYFFVEGFIRISQKSTVIRLYSLLYKTFLDYPKLLLIHPGIRCNRNCEYCYEKNFEYKEEDQLDINFYKKIMPELKKTGITQVQFLGREPLLYKNFEQLMCILKKNDLDVMIYTNGTCFNPKTFKFLSKFKNSVSLAFSLEPEKILNGKNNFKKSFKNLLKAKDQYSINVKTFIAVTKENYKYIPEIIEKTYYRHNIIPVFARYIPTGNLKQDKRYSLNPEQWYNILKLQKKIHKKEKIINLGKLSAILRGSGCSDYFDSIHLTYDGKVSPCDYVMDKIIIGDLKRDTISHIWNIYKKKRSKWNYIPIECKNCDYRFFCTGGRKSHSFRLHGDFQHKDPLCENNICPLSY